MPATVEHYELRVPIIDALGGKVPAFTSRVDPESGEPFLVQTDRQFGRQYHLDRVSRLVLGEPD